MQDSQDAISVSIENLTRKGYGIGTLPSGKEIEIPHAVPGDSLLVDWKKKRRPPQKGRILSVLEASPNRVATPCAHAQICGGCCWQQIDYASQLKIKEERVREAFGNKFFVSPILAAEDRFAYRNKMEFTFSENRAGTKFLGLMIAAAEPYVFNVETCHLCPTWFSQVLGAVRTWWEGSGLKAYHPPLDAGTLRYLTLRHAMRTGQKMVILNVSGNPEFAPTREKLDEYVKAVREAVGMDEQISIFLRIHQTKKGKPTQFYEMLLFGPDHIVEELEVRGKKLSFKISPSSFFQPNTVQAEKLYNTALSFMEKADTVFDLYCGTGTLGMACAGSAKRVIGIDLSPDSILDAEANCQRNGIDNATFLHGDVGKVVAELMGKSGFARPDAVIVDPPRAGLDALALHQIKTLLPRSIIYISCNPLTQAENIGELMEAGYRIQVLQPVDQFPQTYHIENIAFLVR